MEPTLATSNDGTSIAWYDFGGSGPDLLLAHASGFCAPMWAEVIELLRDRFHCVAYDSRGHGRSGRPHYGQAGWDWERFADDVTAVIASAGLNNPYGIGHSSGGASLILKAERDPGIFSQLYCFEPVIFDEDPPRGPWPDRELAVRTRKRRSTFDSVEQAFDTFSTRGPFTTLTETARYSYVEHGFEQQPDGSVALRLAPDDEAEVYVMASAHTGYQRLIELTCPVTFAHGEHSTSFTTDEVRHLADRVSGAAFVEFDGLGHFGPLEAPERFAQAVLSTFLP